MNTEGRWDCSPTYSAWFSIPVLLFIIRECRVPVPCNVISESVFALRIRPQPGWKSDVPKQFILAIEEAPVTWKDCNN